MLRHQITQELGALIEKKRLNGDLRRRKSGLVDTHRLYHYRTRTDLFRKRNRVEKGIDLAVVILVDASGSMNDGRKMVLVQKVLPELYHGIKDVTGTNVAVLSFSTTILELVGFNEDYDVPAVNRTLDLETGGKNKYVRKGDKESLWFVPCADTPGVNPYSSGQNHDIAGIGKAIEMLRRTDAATKLLVVLSDGEAGLSPLHSSKKLLGSTLIGNATYMARNKGMVSAMRYLLAIAEQNGIKVASIGIQSDAVKEYYKFPRVCENTKDFGNIFRNVLLNIYQK